MKKTIKTTEYEYDKSGKLVRIVETTTEENTYLPLYPTKPNSPDTTPSVPSPFKPYVGDVWNQPSGTGQTYRKTGGEPLKVTYDEQA